VIVSADYILTYFTMKSTWNALSIVVRSQSAIIDHEAARLTIEHADQYSSGLFTGCLLSNSALLLLPLLIGNRFPIQKKRINYGDLSQVNFTNQMVFDGQKFIPTSRD